MPQRVHRLHDVSIAMNGSCASTRRIPISLTLTAAHDLRVSHEGETRIDGQLQVKNSSPALDAREVSIIWAQLDHTPKQPIQGRARPPQQRAISLLKTQEIRIRLYFCDALGFCRRELLC